MKQPDLTRLLDLQKLLLKFSQIERVVDRRHKDGYVRESDTEHSYNLAMTAWFLAPYFPHLDKDELIRIGLVHDLVEVHAGDTYIYANKELLDSKPLREAAALKQLEQEWPDFTELTNTINSYENRTSEEAKFIYALDKIMPIFVIYISDGYSWKKNNITIEKMHTVKKDKVSLSAEIKPYYDALQELLLASPHLIQKA